MSEPVTRVLIVDDHPIVREGLGMLLATTTDLRVVGAAGTAADAVTTALRIRPDVVVMDLGLPDGTGFAATRDLLLDVPNARVLVLTMDRGRSALAAALDAGARGYVLKDSAGTDILTAIRAVAAGQLLFDPEIATAAVSTLAHGPDARERLFPDLSVREFQVLCHLAAGAANEDIAGRLGLAPKTVQNTVSRILAKLRVATRAEAADAGRAAGLA